MDHHLDIQPKPTGSLRDNSLNHEIQAYLLAIFDW